LAASCSYEFTLWRTMKTLLEKTICTLIRLYRRLYAIDEDYDYEYAHSGQWHSNR